MSDRTYPKALQHLILAGALCSLICAVQSEMVIMSEPSPKAEPSALQAGQCQ
jgi:hypothetical protein